RRASTVTCPSTRIPTPSSSSSTATAPTSRPMPTSSRRPASGSAWPRASDPDRGRDPCRRRIMRQPTGMAGPGRSSMLGLGIATSHPAGMLRNKEDWEAVLRRRIENPGENIQPYSAVLELETPGVIEDYIARVRGALDNLRRQVAEYKPDA